MMKKDCEFYGFQKFGLDTTGTVGLNEGWSHMAALQNLCIVEA